MRETGGLKTPPARTFSWRSPRKPTESGVLGCSGRFHPGGAGGYPRARSPGNGGACTRGTGDSWPLQGEGRRGYREGLNSSPRGSWPCRTPPAGPATAAPTPALTAARAPRESWPAPSNPTSEASARNFLQDKENFHEDHDPLPSTQATNSGCSGNPELTSHV